MDKVKQLLDSVKEVIKANPNGALLATNILTAGVALYIATEGHPVRAITKALFRSIMAAVPQGLVDKEMDKVRADIEKSVIGNSLDGETLYKQLPAEGTYHHHHLVTLGSFLLKEDKEDNMADITSHHAITFTMPYASA